MKRFLAAAAMAPLCFAALEARAQTTINTATTAPVATSSTGDLTIEAAGSITVPDGVAVTVDAPATVVVNGQISILNAQTDVTGILVTAGSGAITTAGAIAIADDDVLADTDNDGDGDGPFVTDPGVRTGIRIVNPFIGAVTIAGGIGVKGNNAAGLTIESGLTGDVKLSGAISVLGTNTYGVRVTGPIIGAFTHSGEIDGTGEGVVGVALDGGVSGRISIDGKVTVSGFRFRTRSNDPQDLIDLDADDLLVGGPAVRIAGVIGGGFVIEAQPPNLIGDGDDADTIDDNLDEDADGILDADEGTGSLLVFGPAPALLIGGAGATTLGNVGTGEEAYGVIIKGTVQAIGLFDGFDAIAVQIGGQGGSVDTGGGILLGPTSSVSSTGFNADADGMRLAAGVIAPVLNMISGASLAATALSSGDGSPTARGLVIEAGASLTRLDNAGRIIGAISGSVGNSVAVVDESGTLSQITNQGFIQAQINSTTLEAIAGTQTALDLRMNTSGVSFTQSTTVEDGAPSVIGDVFLGSGDDTVVLSAGLANGDWDLGTGVNALQINGGANFTGGLITAGSLAVDVGDGELNVTSTANINTTNLSVASDGLLRFTADPLNADPSQRVTHFTTNTASLADGAQVDLSFASKLVSSSTFELITALTPGGLVVGGLDSSLLGDLPFFYQANLATTAQAVQVTVSRRTAAEAGLSGSLAAAYESVFEAFDQDAVVNAQLLSKTDVAGFGGLYQQFLPDYAGGPFRSLSSAARTMMVAQAEDTKGMSDSGGRSWLQEIGFGASHEGGAGEVGYDSAGFGLVGGLETGDRGTGVVGLSFAFVSSDVDNDNRQGDSLLTASALLASAYWRNRLDNDLVFDASVTAGYTWFDSDRDIIDLNSDGARILHRQAGGQWSGALAAARVGATYQREFGRFYVRPEAFLDYVYLYEGGYTEGGAGPALNLTIESRQSYEAGAEAGIAIGARFGRGFRWGPEIRVGYRGILASGLSDTTARFSAITAGTPFTLPAIAVDKGRVVVRAAVRGGSQYAQVSLEGNADIGDLYQAYAGRLVVRFLF